MKLRWRAIAVLAAAFVVAAGLAAGILWLVLPVRPVPINVRWKPEVSTAQRVELERRFRLTDGRPTDGTTWGYVLGDTSAANIRAIIQDPAVDDTAKLNRIRFRPQLSNDRSRLIMLYAAAMGAGAVLLIVLGSVVPLLGAPRYAMRLARRVRARPESRPVAVGVAAGGLGVIVFAFRFLTLRDFPNDHYMYLAWAQQLLFGALPSRDFVDPGYPLTYTLSALIQRGWPGPLGEAVFTIAMLSTAVAVLVLVVERITGSLMVAIIAGAAAIGIQPQLYNYPKLLVPVVALWLLAWHEQQPTPRRRAVLATWTTLSFLFRYDLGLYVAAAMIAALTVGAWKKPGLAMRRIGEYVAAGLIAVLPYLLFVQWAQGISEHVRQTIEFSKNEPAVLRVPTPDFPFLRSGNPLLWGEADSIATLFYFARLFVPLAAIVLIVRRREQRPKTTPAVVAAIVLLAAYDVVILRHPIVTRIRDMAVPMTVVGAWVFCEIVRGSRNLQPSRRFVGYAGVVLAVVVAAASLGSVVTLGKVGEQVRETRVLEGWPKMRSRAGDVVSRTTAWPWPAFWPTGELPKAVEYIERCTAPSDHVLVTWPASEYFFFTRRPFAAGHALFLAPYSFTSPVDQALMLARLQQQRVPIVLINETQRSQFAGAYPLLDAHLRGLYREVGSYTIYDRSRIAIAVDKDLTPTTTYGTEGWPCFRS